SPYTTLFRSVTARVVAVGGAGAIAERLAREEVPLEYLLHAPQLTGGTCAHLVEPRQDPRGAVGVLDDDGIAAGDARVVDALGAAQIVVGEGDGILFAVDDRVEASEQAPAAALIGVLFALAEGVLGGGGSDRLGEAAEGVHTLIVDPLGDTSSVRNGHLAAELVVGECSYLAARVLALDELVEAVVGVQGDAGVRVGVAQKTSVRIVLEASHVPAVISSFEESVEAVVAVVARTVRCCDVLAVDRTNHAPAVVGDGDVLTAGLVGAEANVRRTVVRWVVGDAGDAGDPMLVPWREADTSRVVVLEERTVGALDLRHAIEVVVRETHRRNRRRPRRVRQGFAEKASPSVERPQLDRVGVGVSFGGVSDEAPVAIVLLNDGALSAPVVPGAIHGDLHARVSLSDGRFDETLGSPVVLVRRDVGRSV